MKCRSCSAPLTTTFVDLGSHPSANRLIDPAKADQPEPKFALHVFVCDACLLVQIPHNHAADDIFTEDYVYYASISKGWVAHAKSYVDKVADRFALNDQSFMVEVASNDGYLLQHAVARSIPCLGIDPAAGCADVAKAKGVKTHVGFFDKQTAELVAEERGKADLICANNVFAHVPDINGFAASFRVLLKPEGVLTLEFPHVQRLIAGKQFDTIYDEHYSYFSLKSAQAILQRQGLRVFDVEELPTHGGSLRLYVCHVDSPAHPSQESVGQVLAREQGCGLHTVSGYGGFQAEVDTITQSFTAFLADEKKAGRTVCGFGAAAKGNTFLNACGAGPETLMFVCDDTVAKQGKLLPGSHIPVVPSNRLATDKPDTVVILPWNIAPEVMRNYPGVFEVGGRFVTCIPELRVFDRPAS